MNEKLMEIFNYFRYLRSMQEIVNEILTLDHYVYNFHEETAIDLIDFCIKKYNSEMKLIASLHKDKVIIEDDPHIYETKTEQEVNSDAEYVRDCLIMIGAVKSGIRNSYQEIMEEIS